MKDKQRRPSETLIISHEELTLPPHDKQGVLTVIRGADADLGRSMAVGQELCIGRSESCDLTLGDMQVSSRHARVVLGDQGRYVLEDLGSTNGTRINRKVIDTRTELLEGDKIFVGKTVLRFTMADAIDLVYHDEIKQLVQQDPLTGLESKRCFDDALRTAFISAGRRGSVLSVLMMDMDGLKAINDSHGHLFGAFAIAETGRLIGRLLKGRGRACRFGGDEFTALLPDLARREAFDIAEEIRQRLEQAGLEMDGIPLRPTLSIGVACFPEDGPTVEALIDAADRALYRAKRKGKNRVSD